MRSLFAVPLLPVVAVAADTPVRLIVQPAAVELSGRRDRQGQVV